MRRALSALSLTTGILLVSLVAPVLAHPLGNFSINRYAAIDTRADGLFIEYVIDMAEVPTFQELAHLDQAGMERLLAARLGEWVHGLRLAADGTPMPLTLTAARVVCLPGAGGLPVLRAEADLWAGFTRVPAAVADAWQEARFVYRDTNFAERAGWKEIVVTGPQVQESSAPAADRGSNRLRSYPADLLNRPPSDVEARFSVRLTGARAGGRAVPGSSAAPTFDLSACRRSRDAPAATAGSSGPRPQPNEVTAFGALFNRLSGGRLNSSVFAFALLGAFLLGAYHSFTPGHGKTVLAAYFIGSRGTSVQAVLLGGITTLTHTSGVFVLGLATLFASRYVAPERLYPWLGVLSGAMLLMVGGSLFRRRLNALGGSRPAHGHHHQGDDHGRHHSHDHTHDHASDHDHPDDHTHGHAHRLSAGEVRARDLITLGITGGLLPCPSALVVMLAAISVGQIGLGLLLITAFSLGLAVVLTAGGMLMVYARSFMTGVIDRERGNPASSSWRSLARPALQRLPVFSAAAVALLGLAIIVQTVSSPGFIR